MKAFKPDQSDDFIGKAVGETYLRLLPICKEKLPARESEEVAAFLVQEMMVSLIANCDTMFGRDPCNQLIEKATEAARDEFSGPGMRISFKEE